MASSDTIEQEHFGPRAPDVSHRGHGIVVLYSCKPRNSNGHECLTQSEIARRLAAVKGYEFGGEFDPSSPYDRPLYFVPSETLVTAESARNLKIADEHDLFGGVVPFPFVATKTITHNLPEEFAYAPAGWSSDFFNRVRGNVLPGFSAYTFSDARNAAMQLLKRGKVRVKDASGVGGGGQSVVADADELEACLNGMNADELRRDGMVLEANLTNVVTRSVGQALVGNILATYCGMQCLTTSNHGNEVYGGSNLIVARGDFDALLRLDLDGPPRIAIDQARAYHAAALASYPGLFASRINYDVAQGFDDEGKWHSGVLEQSWRIGGASAAEVAAIEVFQADPGIDVVRASTTEIYGANAAVPHGAIIYYQGIDEKAGPLVKYFLRETYAHS